MSEEKIQRVEVEAELIALVENLVRDSGCVTNFNARVWVTNWLANPHPALGGSTPSAFLDTQEGKDLVVRLLLQIQSGSYA